MPAAGVLRGRRPPRLGDGSGAPTAVAVVGLHRQGVPGHGAVDGAGRGRGRDHDHVIILG